MRMKTPAEDIACLLSPGGGERVTEFKAWLSLYEWAAVRGEPTDPRPAGDSIPDPVGLGTAWASLVSVASQKLLVEVSTTSAMA